MKAIMNNVKTLIMMIMLGTLLSLGSAAHARGFTYQGRSTGCADRWDRETTLRLKFSGGTSGTAMACTYYKGEPDVCERMNFKCPRGNDYTRFAYVSLANSYNTVTAKYTPRGGYSHSDRLVAYAGDRLMGHSSEAIYYGTVDTSLTVSPSFPMRSVEFIVTSVQE